MMKCFVHDGRMFINPVFATAKELQVWLSACRVEAAKALKESGAAHAVYGVKRYDPQTGDLSEADLYLPAVLLDDAEFYSRTDEEAKRYPGCLILALHAMQ